MDWDLEEFPWDSSRLEVDKCGFELKGINKKKSEGDSVDLSLGGASNLMENLAPDTPKELKDSKTVLSKKSQSNNGLQNLFCLVDGCKSNLSDCREYHKRHRVCEKHSKTPVVLVRGKEQRFCQQCSRFHSVGEFDDVKRSCRKRLDGHNRRRRKPQPSPFFMAAEKFLYNYKGPRILQFDSPQTYSNPIMRNMWPTTAKTETEAESGYDRRRLLYRDDNHKQGNELFIWQESGLKANNGNEVMLRTPIYQQTYGANAVPASRKGSRKPYSDSKLESFESSCALYLLSTLQTQSSELSLVQSSITCPIQSSSGSVNLDAMDEYSCTERVMNKPTSPVFVRDAVEADLQCNGMLQIGHDELVKNEDSMMFPSFWE
ncbi:hypothetical protein TanjilG_10318 [Lupinus angustifolius]|uniref:SBP-type domain-containing protein n=1 Tax=Lupinus angustifolius TaxID=3871 RepID=A0A394D5M9_LUPAN|nr:PREDICTED: squamosa promoter-binding-like protein 2 [Lupinus angustifolius]OIW19100.1 hypothetical protein TanjilG_10318 [Lupinus angustifolius]